MVKKKCDNCKKAINVKPSKLKKQKNFFCSRPCKYEYQKGIEPWNKGKKGLQRHTEASKKKLSLSARNNPNIIKTQFKKGHKPSKKSIENWKNKVIGGELLKGEKNGMFGRKGELNPNWKGGISYWRKEFYNSIEYKEWQKAVFKRDNYTCQKCKCGHRKGRILHAHHKKPFATFKELRLILENGVTLCNVCHNFVHSKKNKLGLFIEK